MPRRRSPSRTRSRRSSRRSPRRSLRRSPRRRSPRRRIGRRFRAAEIVGKSVELKLQDGSEPITGPEDFSNLIASLQTVRVSEGSPALPSQTAGASEPPHVDPLQRDPEQLYDSEDDDMEFPELNSTIVPGGRRDVLTSHTSTTDSTRQTHIPSCSYGDHPITSKVRRSAGPEVQAALLRRRNTHLMDSQDDNPRDRSRSPRSTGRDTRTQLTRETP